MCAGALSVLKSIIALRGFIRCFKLTYTRRVWDVGRWLYDLFDSASLQVVFHKMSPNETLFLESTSKIVRDDVNNSSFVQFEIWDFPGQIDPFDPTFDSEVIFGGCGALIFVIDSQVRPGVM